MLEAYGNIWDIADEGGWDALVITTNGFVRKDGEAVMGRGIALEANNRYPGLAKDVGTRIRNFGNNVHIFFDYDPKFELITFPVKPIFGPNGEPGWKAKAQFPIILSSIEELLYFVDRYDWMDILMPRPGAGNGGLDWKQVKSKIEPLLDNRFTVVSWHP